MQNTFITAAGHTGAQCGNRKLGRIALIQARTTRPTENLIRALLYALQSIMYFMIHLYLQAI